MKLRSMLTINLASHRNGIPILSKTLFAVFVFVVGSFACMPGFAQNLEALSPKSFVELHGAADQGKSGR